MPIHERFDLAYWTAQFPLATLRAEARAFVQRRRADRPDQYQDEAAVERHIALMDPHGDIVVGPMSVAVNEQLRAEATAQRVRCTCSCCPTVGFRRSRSVTEA
ncbi:MAG: hypothetical protein H0W08_21795 [Acidobacteria bacterium]|nr:hypothetical protein [Acidobacteriota bacterium]